MLFSRNDQRNLLPALLVALLIAPNAMAVVVDSGDGSGNTTAQLDDPGFANVGLRGVASAVYLGNRWVMTAAHVGPGHVTFGDTEFSIVPSETVRLGNPEGSSPETDILLLRLAEDPQLRSLRLPCEPRRLGTELVMIGNGHDRAPEPTYWRVEVGPDPNDDVWTEVATESQSDRQGFKTLESQSIRWGMGAVGNVDLVTETPHGDVLTFSSSFSKALNVANLGQAVRGDSGGAVFEKNWGVWELTGLIYAVNPLENQPNGTRTAVYGETTLLADLYRYKELILQVADFEPQQVDVNGDGSLSASEVDALIAAQALGDFASCHYDLDGNGTVNSLDVEALWDLPEILIGDTNLDGEVGFADFLILSKTFGSHAAGWSNGDFDGDGQITFTDFLRLGGNFGRKIDVSAPTVMVTNAAMTDGGDLTDVAFTGLVSSVPESELPALVLLLVPWLTMRRRR